MMYTHPMPKKVYTVAEARAQLPTILNEVGAGDEVYLTRRGRATAVVVSTKTYEALTGERPTFQRAYGDFLKRHAPKDLALDPNYFDDLRDRSPGRKVRL
jgi:prevent-host-death family protein